VIETPAALAVRRLLADDRAAILAHLLALDCDDRYGRFVSALSDHAIATYVGRLSLDHDAGFGIVDASGLRSGFIHLAVHAPSGEIGASVLPKSRRQGLASRLFAAAFRHARHRGLDAIHLASGHPAALHIYRSLGLAVDLRPTTPRAIVRLA
jgi:GNAT superfamily N-acetyltransferase